MANRPYQVCTNCVMDTTDSKITFDEKGVCDHCNDFYENVLPTWHTDERGRNELESLVGKIKREGNGRDFDCIMGMSGGADSSYMLHMMVKEFGLRPLVFHVDGGWNSQIAVNNIEVLVDKLGLDLYTEVINWEDMKDFQLAYFKSGISSIDIPQDLAFIAVLYKYAHKYNIKYILNGGNISTECVRNPLEWIYYADMSVVNDIRKQFCTRPLKYYPFSNILWHKVYLRYVRKIKVVKPLNLIPYNKEKAMQELQQLYGWEPYPQKHFESRFTRFFEGYWLPKKFGYDTRKVQYSSLILTGQMKREDALKKLKEPAIEDSTARQEFEYVASKLEITPEELQSYMDAPNKSYKDYSNKEWLYNLGAKALKLVGVEKSIKR